MTSAAGRDPHVLPENWCPLIRWYFDQMNVASASLTDNCFTMRSLHILYPIGILSEHRYEITPSCYGRNHHWVRASAAGPATLYFKGSLKLWRQPQARPPARKAIHKAPQECRAPVAVKQPH